MKTPTSCTSLLLSFLLAGSVAACGSSPANDAELRDWGTGVNDVPAEETGSQTTNGGTTEGEGEGCEPYPVREAPFSGCVDAANECEEAAQQAPEVCGDVSCELCMTQYHACENTCRYGGGIPGDTTPEEFCGQQMN